MDETDSFEACVNRLYEVIVRDVLMRTSVKMGSKYPNLPLEWLIPPFIELKNFHLPEQINITLDEKFDFKKHGRFFPSRAVVNKKNLDRFVESQGLKYQFDGDHRDVNHQNFYSLFNAVVEANGASIIAPVDEKHYKLTYFKARIEDVHRDCEKSLKRELRRRKPKEKRYNIPRMKDDDAVLGFYRRLNSKKYELIGVRDGGGTKHSAAGFLMSRFTGGRIVIDLLSKSGVYSRLSRTPQGNARVMHTVIKRASEMPKIKGFSLDDYTFGKENNFVVFCVEYGGNNRYHVDQCWIDVSKQYFLNPKGLKEKVVADVLGQHK